MFKTGDRPRIFALPPGAEFPREVVRGLTGRLADAPPEAMARVTLYLNTGRMLRAVRAAFADRKAHFLPRLRLVSDLALDPVPGLPLPEAPLSRRFELMRLVGAKLKTEGKAGSGVRAFDLADSLARLLEEMQGEGVAPEAFNDPDLAADHARHWERSLAFLRIVTAYLSDDGRPDPEGRRRRVVTWLAERWPADPPPGPVLVAGSTGSRGTTQAFMQAVARLPQGAVILPGFDFDLPENGWNSLDSGTFPTEDHPQYRYRALLRSLDLSPRDVTPWQADTAPDKARNRVVSLALRPAPVTDRWLAEGPQLGDLTTAMRGATVLHAQDAREEAVTIALILRDAVERGLRAQLISPDRVLTRRVTAALDRWGLIPDDSAGRPLIQSAAGRFLRQTAALAIRRAEPEDVLAVLKHPLTATGGTDRGRHLLFTRDLELRMRGKGLLLDDPTAVRAWAACFHDPQRVEWIDWLLPLLAPVDIAGERPLGDWIARHLALAETIAAGPWARAGDSELWEKEAGEAARRRMDTLAASAGEAPGMGGFDYLGLLDSSLSEGTIRQSDAAHPLIAIRGTLEARVLGADLVILAGLNEGIWPAAPEPDPWLSRQMRHQVGLLSPERQIGLSAHDFQQAAGAGQVVFSRALRDDESETVPSRWLSRLESLMKGLPDQSGPQAWKGMLARGADWLTLARVAEAPEAAHRMPPARRPAPRPPVKNRPTELPVTDITTLIRDPYAIYAKRILRLRRLEPIAQRPDGRLRGIVLHAIMERFIKERSGPEEIGAALGRLRAIARAVIDAQVPWPGARILYLAKLDRIAGGFLVDEARRAAAGRALVIEDRGEVGLDRVDFTLTARPDRIDLLADGRVHIYDYKSGQFPSFKQQEHFDKQLRLEAAMAERGAFETLGKAEVAGATHIALGSGAGEHSARLTPEIIDASWDGLLLLIATYMRRETGYTARRAVFEARIAGDYDHLARAGEWEMSDPSAPEDVG